MAKSPEASAPAQQSWTTRLCGRDVLVRIGDNHSWDSESMGRSHLAKGAIHLSDELDADGRRSVLLHEVIHFVADSLDLDVSEKQVAGLEIGLLQALRDNPSWCLGFVNAKK